MLVIISFERLPKSTKTEDKTLLKKNSTVIFLLFLILEFFKKVKDPSTILKKLT